jgi:flagellar basal-body rod protein FlgB
MDLTQIPLFSALVKRMSWLTDRQAVIAQNVASADIPGYQGQDLRESDFAKLLTKSSPSIVLATTDPAHIAPKPASPMAPMLVTTGHVSLEEQMLKTSQTSNDYALVATVYRANLGMLKTVLGRSGS